MKQNPEATNVQIIQAGRLTFYLSEHRIGLENGLQFFSIEGANQYCTKQVRFIRQQIELGNIKSFTDFYDLAERKVLLKYSRRAWFDHSVNVIDAKKQKPVVAVVEEPSMAILLEPEATETTPLVTTLMAVEV